MGSAVALAISNKKQNLINKLVLITPFSWLGGAVYKDKFAFQGFCKFCKNKRKTISKFESSVKIFFSKKANAIKDEYTDWAWNNLHKHKDDFIYEDGGRFVVPYDARPWLANIKSNTLVITGGKDKLVPEETSNDVINRLENVSNVVFKDAGHSVPWTHAEELVESINNFISS